MWPLLILRYRRLNNEQKKRFKWGGQLKNSGNHTIITRLSNTTYQMRISNKLNFHIINMNE